MRYRAWALGIVALLLAFSCSSKANRNPRLRIFCAASLTQVLNETIQSEEIQADVHSGGSNSLVRQVNSGASSDLLLLADEDLANRELAPKGYTVSKLCSNQLVIIAPARSPQQGPTSFPLVLTSSPPLRLALADPQTAPLGAYTKAALAHVNIATTPILLEDATAVVSTIALGHADLGIVYKTDAGSQTQVKILSSIPRSEYPNIHYVAALPPHASPQAQQLVHSLQQGRGQEFLKRHGFLPLSQPISPETSAKP